MSLQLNKNFVVIAGEPSYGVDGVEDTLLNGGASDVLYYLPIQSVSITPEADNDQPDRATAYFGGKARPYVQRRCTFEITLPLVIGDGTMNGQPPYAAALRGCNMQETQTTSTLYEEITTNLSSFTLHQYVENARNTDFRLRRVVGARGTAEISLTMGEEATITITGSGFYDSIGEQRTFFSNGELVLTPGGTDASAYAGSFEKVTLDPIYPQEMSFSVDGTNYTIGSMTYTQNITQDEIAGITNPKGEHEQVNTRGNSESPEGGFDLLDSSPGDFDSLIASYESRQKVPINAQVQEPGGTGVVNLDFPRSQILGPEEQGEEGNLLMHTFNFVPLVSTGVEEDNGVQIEFNPAP